MSNQFVIPLNSFTPLTRLPSVLVAPLLSSPLLLVTPLTRLPSLLVAPLLLHQWNPVFSFFYLILPFSLFTLLFTHRHFTHAFCTATTPSWPQSYINSFNLVSLLFTISLSLISSSPLSLIPSLSLPLSLSFPLSPSCFSSLTITRLKSSSVQPPLFLSHGS